jgi:hypothetical protein
MVEMTGKYRFCARRFCGDERGSLTLFALLIVLGTAVSAGLAIDVIRYEWNRVRLQSTLDRAALAAASHLQKRLPRDVVEDYFTKAELQSYLGEVDVVEDFRGREVTVAANMPTPSLFLRLLGIEHLNARAAGTAEERNNDVEISLVLDVSGSMNGEASGTDLSKLEAMQKGVVEFGYGVQCAAEGPDIRNLALCTRPLNSVSVNLVPFSEQVSAGEALLAGYNVTDEHRASACVTFGSNDFDSAALDPFTPLDRTGHFDPRSKSDSPSDWVCPPDASRAITPLIGDPRILETQINALTASGSTSIDIGIRWGLALLDPSSQTSLDKLRQDGLVDVAFQDRPFQHRQRGTSKVLILMTDGHNTSQYALRDEYRSGTSPVRMNKLLGKTWIYNDSTYTYHLVEGGEPLDPPFCFNGQYGTAENGLCAALLPGFLEAQTLSWPELWAERSVDWWNDKKKDADLDHMADPAYKISRDEKDRRLEAQCAAARDAGVMVFTIGHEIGSRERQMLRSCASSPSHYFDTKGGQISESFLSIAAYIQQLKLIR